MVTHKHYRISYAIPTIAVCCSTKNAKMVTQTIKKREICPRINISSAKMVTHNQNNFCHNSRSARKTETETLFSLLRINKIPFPLARARYARMRVLSSFFFEFYFV